MKQQTLAMAAEQTSGFEQHRKPTRREEFLKTMQAILPWAALCEVIEPYYPKAGNGRPPIGLERMLRIHFIQHWFNLADLACEEVRCTTVPACVASWESIWGASRCPMPPPCSSFANFSTTTNSAKLCFLRWAKCCKTKDSKSTPEPSSTRLFNRRAQFDQERRQGA